MYKFNSREFFPCAPRTIIERSMYNFDEYAKFAPNVTRVEVLSRNKTDDGREKIAVRVYAKGWLPPIVKTIFRQTDVNWKEHYDVHLDTNTVDWRIETPMFTEYVDCKGTSYAREAPGGCEMVITGDMTIKAMPVPGVPEAVVRAAIGTVEPFIGRLVVVNLKKYFGNIRRCLQEEARGKG